MTIDLAKTHTHTPPPYHNGTYRDGDGGGCRAAEVVVVEERVLAGLIAAVGAELLTGGAAA